MDSDGDSEAHLVVLVGHAMGTRYDIGDVMELGRSPQSPVEILDDGVSRRHAQIVRLPDATYVIRDLGSRNGTFVNGRKIDEAKLEFGDRIAVGSQTVLLFTHRDRFEEKRIQAQKLQTLGQLAGGIAHDFNNLLGVVLANITHVQSLEHLDEAVVRKTLSEVETAARRAVDLTHQLLAFARSGKRQHQPLDVAGLIGDAVRLLRRTLHRSIELRTEAVAGLVVLGDSSQLLQVLMNLCINAGDAMPDGGVLFVSAEHRHIEEDELEADALLSPGRYVALRVRDEGVGMDDETRRRLFEPFFTTKPRGKGTGLGLATASAIVRDHGGHIGVTSELGKGSAFEVLLPAANADPVTASRLTEEQHVPRRGTVLLADDEELIRQATRRVLEYAGMTVFLAHDGEEAVSMYQARREEIDVVILDLDMPRLNGEQALARLKDFDPDVKVLISSGYIDRERESSLRDAGVDGLFYKPYDSLTLMQAIGKVLRPVLASP